MKAIVSVGPGKSEIREMPMPVMNDDQLLIRTRYVGVCMSEHDAWRTAKPGDAFGHEPMGIVEKVGKNVKGFAVGDRVSGLWGGSLPGAGGMVEYNLATPGKDVVVKLPDELEDTEAILEPLTCLMSAVSKVRKGVPGSTVAIVGCGYMGCGALSLLKACGAYIVAVDIRETGRADAKKYGADEVYTYEEARDKFDTEKGFEGFDAVMEWGGNNDSLDLAIHMTKMCGQLCVAAYHTGGKRQIDLQLLNVRAIEMLSTHPREDALNRIGAPNAARMLLSGAWKYRHVPTMVYSMKDFDRAHAELETKYGHHMKAVIDMNSLDAEPYLL